MQHFSLISEVFEDSSIALHIPKISKHICNGQNQFHMKKQFAFFLCIMLGLTLSAQQKTETLLSSQNSYGGFGGPIIEFSNINGTLVGDVGGGGAFVVNNFFLGGYGLGNGDSQVTITNELYDINFRHGGFWMGYAFKQYKVIHIYSSFRVGWGQAELLQNDQKFYSDNLLALAPELGLELNISNWFKVALTGGLRTVSGIQSLPELGNDDFTGFFGGITFRFGGFGDYESYQDEDAPNQIN